ncbi:MFS general substrate transporter [Pseudovirgaria hyperparasitica]|uniref:MFS general substrate transporter n=1 Tax=Pseudovirgaria hyperparasitica TaxID=470096 RepID=A0A6A6VTR0_9PEZI|nr:MFS general substrate transporter [Pseudovirgaria hyperparasitica]KAF2754078.1 MFS general substrate transporter [Pseudovirgaria hyperparasitica]
MSTGLSSLKWFYHEFGLGSIHETGRDAYLIILARSCRMFAYGTNSLILAIFFSALDFSDHQIGAFMTLTLVGDVFLGTFLTLIADRVGRRRVLLAGSVLMILSGAIFAIFENFWILLLAAIVGVISITGGDYGPFRAVEESMLSQLTTPSTRSDVLAWYVTISAIGSSIGSEASGRIVNSLQNREGWEPVSAYHMLFWIYAAMGIVNVVMVLCLTDACEAHPSDSYAQIPQEDHHPSNGASSTHNTPAIDLVPPPVQSWPAKAKSWFVGSLSQISAPTRSTMYKLWFLLSVDSLADGMVPWSITNYYTDTKFHPAKSTLGDITSVGYFLAAIGAVFAGPLARKLGLINTMVFTHVPSSAAVVLFPAAPYLWMAALLLFVRAGLNNMDQAPRVAFISAVVKPSERTAVMGITSTLRTLAATAGPTVTGLLAGGDRFWVAFVAAGLFRLAYDFGLYFMFRNMELHQHEPKTEEASPNGHGTRRERDEEDVLEMASLTDSQSSDDGGEDGELITKVNSGLQLPRSNERVRSRSPHRSTE